MIFITPPNKLLQKNFCAQNKKLFWIIRQKGIEKKIFICVKKSIFALFSIILILKIYVFDSQTPWNYISISWNKNIF